MLYEEDVHIKQIYRSAFFHLHSIVKTKQNIPSESNADKLVHGFIMLRLKYCNSSLSGLSKIFTKNPQLIQNTAVRVLTGNRKRDISPILVYFN